MPSDNKCSFAAWSCSANWAASGFGISFSTKYEALSISNPVGLPAASLTISPPEGLGVVAVIPAFSKATVLTQTA